MVGMDLCSIRPTQTQKNPQYFDKIHIFDIVVVTDPISLKFTWQKLIYLLRKLLKKNLISVIISQDMSVSDSTFFFGTICTYSIICVFSDVIFWNLGYRCRISFATLYSLASFNLFPKTEQEGTSYVFPFLANFIPLYVSVLDFYLLYHDAANKHLSYWYILHVHSSWL